MSRKLYRFPLLVLACLLFVSFLGVNPPKAHAQVFYAGAWIAPTADNFATTPLNGNQMNLKMQLTGVKPSEVAYVAFVATWPQMNGNAYIISEINPTSGNTLFQTTWDLTNGRGLYVPLGQVQVKFIIYTTPASQFGGYAFDSGYLTGTIYKNFAYKLFMLTQGINTSYSGSGVPSDFTNMVKTLQTSFPGAHFFYYSYPSSTYPKYSCRDTFTDDIANDVTYLSIQVNQQIAAHPEIRQVDLLGHSLGALVGVAYATAVVDNVGTIFALPSTAKLHSIAGFDGAIGGVTAGIVGNILTNVVANACFGSIAHPTLTALNQLKTLYNTATDHTNQGSSAIIVKAIFGQAFSDSNKIVADKAKYEGITFFEVGNTKDPLFAAPPTNAVPCTLVKDKFPTTQWVNGYGYRFTSTQTATCDKNSIATVHKLVLSLSAVLQATVQVVNDFAPTNLTSAP